MAQKRTLGVVLFPGFELLDVFGPLEMMGFVGGEIEIHMLAETTGPVASVFGPQTVAERSFAECPHIDLLFVPGGLGTRSEVDNVALGEFLVARAASAELVLSVCTGAGLLARAG